ncbi:hypothetical protein [Sorangium atrum]|uniref:Lipoprotein n=1 Tax=Sorangium atrum TaxID=2995308 RepID=A0ABT5BXB2_9BACT|nr:hypothetical protein [Sorangium aterium]MDC0677617.1 hypothetical protein [Sorangium aterium]
MSNVLIVVFMLIVGCGGEAPAASYVACEFTGSTPGGVTVRSCAELETYDADKHESQCKDTSNLEAELVDRCSTDDVLGACVLTGDGETMTTYYYEAGPLTADIVKPICDEVNGTWTPR